MKQAVVSLSVYLRLVVAGVGFEGFFLGLGTALLAVGASFIAPAGPWLVVGSVALLLGLALAIPNTRAD